MYYFNFGVYSDERYDPEKFMRNSESILDGMDSYFLVNLSELPAIGTYTISSEIGRPDLLSYAIYNDVNLWWILLYYNSIMSYHELVVGLKISFPSIESIEDLYFKLKSKELREL